MLKRWPLSIEQKKRENLTHVPQEKEKKTNQQQAFTHPRTSTEHLNLKLKEPN